MAMYTHCIYSIRATRAETPRQPEEHIQMIMKIHKWGNSLGLRIPRFLAKQAGIEEGTDIDISLEG